MKYRLAIYPIILLITISCSNESKRNAEESNKNNPSEINASYEEWWASYYNSMCDCVDEIGINEEVDEIVSKIQSCVMDVVYELPRDSVKSYSSNLMKYAHYNCKHFFELGSKAANSDPFVLNLFSKMETPNCSGLKDKKILEYQYPDFLEAGADSIGQFKEKEDVISKSIWLSGCSKMVITLENNSDYYIPFPRDTVIITYIGQYNEFVKLKYDMYSNGSVVYGLGKVVDL